MAAYVALLRGIAPRYPKMRNVELRRVFTGLGLDDVRTVISSGNVLFSSEDRSPGRLEARIERAMLDHLGAPCTTIVRSRGQVDRLARLDVFAGHGDAPDARCNVTFLKRRPLASASPPVGDVGAEVVGVLQGTVFFVADPEAPAAARLMAAIERTYGDEATTRTWKTVHRIAAAFAR